MSRYDAASDFDYQESIGSPVPRQTRSQTRTPKLRYCEMCDRWLPATQTECRACGMPTAKPVSQQAMK